jgi:hypothetical protein
MASDRLPIGVGNAADRASIIKEYCSWNGRWAADIVGSTAIGTVLPGVGNVIGFLYGAAAHTQNCWDAQSGGSAHLPSPMDIFDHFGGKEVDEK